MISVMYVLISITLLWISGEISRLRLFGEELHCGLENARMFEVHAYWMEEDYCSPTLAMERRSVLKCIEVY
jgi:hypothetical protein